MQNNVVITRPAYRSFSLRIRNKADVLYQFIILSTWVIPVGLTILSVAQHRIVASAIFAATISSCVILLKPKTVLFVLPFFALLSPVAGFLDIFGAALLLSDLLFILLAIQFGVLVLKKKIRIYRSSLASLQALIAILFIISSVAGVLLGTLKNLKPLVYLIQLTIIYYYTTTFAKNEESWSLVIDSWLVAAFLGALLLIQAFITGIPLGNFMYGTDLELIDRESLNYLFQATYYYAGFHYILGISVVILNLKILFSKSKPARLFLFIILIVLLLALFMMMNKTAFFGIALSLIIVGVSLFSYRYRQKKKTLKVFLLFAVFVGIGYGFVLSGFFGYVDDYQANLWIRRVFTSSSFDVRVEVYLQAFKSWISFPLQLIIGMGPDFLDNSGHMEIADSFKISSVTGLAEGTVDSGWISYLIELGIISFTALVFLFFMSIRASLRYLKTMGRKDIHDTQILYVLGGLIYIVFALSTQMLGYTKLSWLPFQLLIIGLMCKQYVFRPLVE